MVALECPALSANPAANQSNNHCGICCGIPRRCWEGDRGMGPAGVALGGGSRESRRWSEVTKAAWHPSNRGILRLGGPLMPRGRIFLSLWVLGWEDRRFRISSSSLRGGDTFPKPTAASLRCAANCEPHTPCPPPNPLEVTAARLEWQGRFLGCHNSPPFPPPPSFPALTPIPVPCGHQGQPGSLAGWPRGQGRVARAGGQGRWPCWEPCPREDVTTCFWCALASGSINALLAAGTSCTAGHGRGDGHLDTDPRGDGHLDSHTHTHTQRDTGTATRPPLHRGHGHQLHLSVPNWGDWGADVPCWGDKPPQAGADALRSGGGAGLPRAFGGRGGSSFPSDC